MPSKQNENKSDKNIPKHTSLLHPTVKLAITLSIRVRIEQSWTRGKANYAIQWICFQVVLTSFDTKNLIIIRKVKINLNKVLLDHPLAMTLGHLMETWPQVVPCIMAASRL